MGNTSSSYLESVGRGGTSNQTQASFQIGRARRQSEAQMGRGFGYMRHGSERMGEGVRLVQGGRRSLEALQDYEDTPFGPQLTYEASIQRGPRNRLMGNQQQPTLIDKARLRPRGSGMTAEQARTGARDYYRTIFNDPNYGSNQPPRGNIIR